MFNNLKEAIAKKIFVRRFKPLERKPIIFNSFVKEARKFLILLPQSKEMFEQSLKIVEFLKNAGKEISLIVQGDLLEGTNLLEFNLKPFTEEDKTKLGAPSKKFLTELRKNDYDVYIDLSFSHNSFEFAIGCAAKAKFKIAFNKKGAEIFGNFILPLEENNPLNSYENFLNSLEMF